MGSGVGYSRVRQSDTESGDSGDSGDDLGQSQLATTGSRVKSGKYNKCINTIGFTQMFRSTKPQSKIFYLILGQWMLAASNNFCELAHIHTK